MVAQLHTEVLGLIPCGTYVYFIFFIEKNFFSSLLLMLINFINVNLIMVEKFQRNFQKIIT